ncbi:hypothetical protein O9993_11085 [Vibrio lentus]|nr:hypothetical protein [Vibrio lentus]
MCYAVTSIDCVISSSTRQHRHPNVDYCSKVSSRLSHRIDFKCSLQHRNLTGRLAVFFGVNGRGVVSAFVYVVFIAALYLSEDRVGEKRILIESATTRLAYSICAVVRFA